MVEKAKIKNESDQSVQKNLKTWCNDIVEKNNSISIFSFLQTKRSLGLLEHLVERTGGSHQVYILDRLYRSEDFYYDLYHYLQEKHFTRVEVKVHTSKGLKCSMVNGQ